MENETIPGIKEEPNNYCAEELIHHIDIEEIKKIISFCSTPEERMKTIEALSKELGISLQMDEKMIEEMAREIQQLPAEIPLAPFDDFNGEREEHEDYQEMDTDGNIRTARRTVRR